MRFPNCKLTVLKKQPAHLENKVQAAFCFNFIGVILKHHSSFAENSLCANLRLSVKF
ncbi:hypothetical protein NEIELOOT_00237 [Neisseria elongata subsp. glycolytica ATCC 29315]|uniref:Uncharacterized protein n=1 Tax=Neisseria elongata subsp. glycolytica ATCC 29315 TaxID=546263 RepID=D4DMG9_NEIEG|nr:hypothetical protein NEIELOOT_00237 [Neisseria elongata subsp. glycolytica ATCC 29315]